MAFINDMPIWAELLVLLIGIIFLWFAFRCLKSGETRGPWYLMGFRFHKEKNPILYWFFVALWFGIGLALLLFSIILLLPI
jgi:hypothetical protein